MKRLVWNELGQCQRWQALARPMLRSDRMLRERVREIVEDVRVGGWTALAKHSLRLDGQPPRRVTVAPFAEAARRSLTAEQVAALELAQRNVTAFHEASRPTDLLVETMPGVTVRKVWRAVDRVGLYIPGGTSPLFSTLLMLALPARAAGVPEIVVATPPRPDGSIEPVLALAASLCGIDEVWLVGGAQAVAALAFGAGEIPAVAKICGPGNAYVTEAKICVSAVPGGPAIDMPAGPSELVVIADETADAKTVAADLLSQAEHDPSAQVMLVTSSGQVADQVERAIVDQLATLPRAKIAADSLKCAAIVLVDSLEEAVEVANLYAPEHLSLAVADPAPLVAKIRSAGAVFAGRHAAETFGDYVAGSSHVLPTDGAARAWSGVSVQTFMKAITVQEVSREAARALAGPAAALARLEGLEAHARAADIRSEGIVRDEGIAA